MGLSGILLKRKDEIDPLKIIEDIKISAQRAGLLIFINEFIYKEDGSYKYTTANVANKLEDSDDEEQFLMYIFGKSKNIYDDEFDWIIENGLLNQVINIENFHGCEKILLDFVYEYLKLNPDDIFWGDLDWFYTFTDIELIKQRDFDRDWPYKKPDWK